MKRVFVGMIGHDDDCHFADVYFQYAFGENIHLSSHFASGFNRLALGYIGLDIGQMITGLALFRQAKEVDYCSHQNLYFEGRTCNCPIVNLAKTL